MNINKFVGTHLNSHVVLAEKYGHDIIDDDLAQCVSKAMKEKLSAAREKGRGGWWREECTESRLKQMLIEHIDKGDMLDVINLSAMIWAKRLMSEYK